MFFEESYYRRTRNGFLTALIQLILKCFLVAIDMFQLPLECPTL